MAAEDCVYYEFTMNKTLILFSPLVLGSALAASPVAATLNYQTGSIPILNGKATVQATPQLRFLDSGDARRVVIDIWGNPPEVANDVLGMLVPGNADPASQQGWAIVLTESKEGHVSDSDAAGTDYTSLLKNMQSAVVDNNEARKKAGYEPVTLVGWAEQPSYEAASHKMYWAKELAFGTDTGDHSLNYDVRVLGRDDVLKLNAVGNMSQLPAIRKGMQSVLHQVSFNAGSRYEDYDSSTDKLATYGVAGLIAGGLAAKKLGLLALIPLLLKKGGILIVLLLGLLSRIGAFFKRRSGAAPAVTGPTAVATGRPPVAPPDAQPVSLLKAVDRPRSGRPAGRHGD